MNEEIVKRINGLKSLIKIPVVDSVKLSQYQINENRIIYAIDIEMDGD